MRLLKPRCERLEVLHIEYVRLFDQPHCVPHGGCCVRTIAVASMSFVCFTSPPSEHDHDGTLIERVIMTVWTTC